MSSFLYAWSIAMCNLFLPLATLHMNSSTHELWFRHLPSLTLLASISHCRKQSAATPFQLFLNYIACKTWLDHVTRFNIIHEMWLLKHRIKCISPTTLIIVSIIITAIVTMMLAGQILPYRIMKISVALLLGEIFHWTCFKLHCSMTNRW